MKKRIIYIWILLFVASSSYTARAKRIPVAHLFQVNGKVEYSKPGKKWKKLKRNKLIFEGTQVRTHDNASVKILDQNNTILALQAKSKIAIEGGEIKLISGNLTKEKDAGNLMNGLQKRFKIYQKYAATRRTINKDKKPKLLTGNLALSSDYPELIWENFGEDYQYKIHVAGKILDVPASDAEVVRFKISHLTNKNNPYTIDVLQGNEVISTSKPKKILWMNEEEQSQVRQGIKSIQEIDGEGFLLGNYLEEQGLLVPALEQYVAFFNNNEDDPDDNEMRPLLIQIYASLKLNKLRHQEVKIYNKIRFESN